MSGGTARRARAYGRDGGADVSVLGLGPMGRALARAFLAAGHRTTVWNRTADRADELVADGAVRAETPAAAVAASPLSVVCVIDYVAVRAVADAAGDALAGRTLVNLTSGTPEDAREMTAPAGTYLDGTILTPVPTIGGSGASLLFSGPEEVYEKHRETLAALGPGTYLGPDPGRAAAYDVALLDMFWTAVGGVTHGFALAGAEGVPAAALAPYARGIGTLLPAIVEKVSTAIGSGRYPGDASTLASARAGMAHVAATARAHGLDVRALDAFLSTTREAIKDGHADDGIARLTTRFTPTPPR